MHFQVEGSCKSISGSISCFHQNSQLSALLLNPSESYQTSQQGIHEQLHTSGSNVTWSTLASGKGVTQRGYSRALERERG